jgi:predicted N-acetyltransferase YhbS
MDLIVRPIENDAERLAYFQLASQAFDPNPSEGDAEEWARFVLSTEEYRPDIVRGAFRDGALVGGCLVYARQMRIGDTLIPVACIGAVVTDPQYRGQGIASVFLRDAGEYARTRGDGLLLLDGIPHFYHQFGYANVIDISDIVIARAALGDLPSSNVIVRLATLDDVAALRDLYETAYRGRTGSFARSVARQHERLFTRMENPPYIALRDDGMLCGYLSVQGEAPRQTAYEVIALDAPAIIALLRHHMAIAPEGDLLWRMPPDAPVTFWLQDHLSIPGYEQHTNPSTIGAVTTRRYHQRNTGWMAKIASFAALQTALLPEWQRRWQAAHSAWRGALALTVGDLGDVTIVCDDGGLHLANETITADLRGSMPETLFTQLLFGYRPGAWIAAQPDTQNLTALLPMLEILRPAGCPWIPSSDGF